MTLENFIYGLEEKVNPAALEDKSSVFHFDLDGDEGGQYTLTIEDGTMDIKEGIIGEAKCTIRGKGSNFMKVINGEMKPLMALMMGKVKVSNQGELMKYAKIFGIM